MPTTSPPSIRRLSAKEIASPLASRRRAVESATASTPQTVELKLKEPSAPLLSSLATIAIVPRSVETNKDALQKRRSAQARSNSRNGSRTASSCSRKLTAIGKQGLPKLAGLKFNIVPESATRQVGLVNGQYALLPNIDAATALQLKGKPNVKLAETLELAYTLIGMNVSKPPFDNPKVREAAELRAQPQGDRRRGAVRRRRARRTAVAGAQVLGARCEASSPATRTIPRRRRRC